MINLLEWEHLEISVYMLQNKKDEDSARISRWWYRKTSLTKLEESAINKEYLVLILETSDKTAANVLYKNYGFVGIKQEIIEGTIAHDRRR
jgi:hypothetical protein